jgi:hypothetical protein
VCLCEGREKATFSATGVVFPEVDSDSRKKLVNVFVGVTNREEGENNFFEHAPKHKAR